MEKGILGKQEWKGDIQKQFLTISRTVNKGKQFNKRKDIHWTYRSCCLVIRSCPTLCDPMDCSTPGFPSLSFTISWRLLKLMSIESVMPSNHLALCHLLLLSPSFFPSIRVFPNESVLGIKWPKYWSFSFSINPSNEYSGLISFRIDCFDPLAG